MSVLENLRGTTFEGAKLKLKLDSSTQKGEFVSSGTKSIVTATYKVCKFTVQKEYITANKKKYFLDIAGNYCKDLLLCN